MSHPRRVLMVDLSRTSSFGGSKRVLCNLALRLRERGWEPVPVFQPEGPYAALLRSQGIPVTILRNGRPESTDADPGASEAPRQHLTAGDCPSWSVAALPRRSRLGIHRTPEGSLGRAAWRDALRDLRSWIRWGVVHPMHTRRLPQLLEPRPAILHINAPCHDDYVWVGLARRAGIPYFTHEHGVWVQPPAAFRRVAQDASGVFCLTSERVREVEAFAGASAHAVCLPNGLDLARFVARRSREEVRAELGIGPDEFVILTPGHIQPWKGQALIPEAALQLRSEGTRFTWLMCGQILRIDYSEEIRARLRELGLEDRVRILGHRDDMPDLYAAVDLTVHTTIQPEPFGMILIESMAMGTPVVGARAGAVPEIIREGTDGLLYEPGDVEDLVRAIRVLAGSPCARREMGRSSRERVEVEFHIDRQVSRLIACYEEATTAGPSRNGRSGRD